MSLEDALAKIMRDANPESRALALNDFVHQAELLRTEASKQRAIALRELSAAGWPGKEIARLIDVSKGRVSQLLNERPQRRRASE